MSPRLDDKPFKESCCDGGECGLDEMSAQPCGCDKKANWTCAQHSGVPLDAKEWRCDVCGKDTLWCGCARTHMEQRVVSRHDEPEPFFRKHEEEEIQRPSPVEGTAKWRKERPLATGVLDYFYDALLEVAHCSYVGNEQHNPGQPLHWDRSKSQDEADACMRHLGERGKIDTDGVRHSAKAAWRALANLQKEIEAERASNL